jgi:hypothetical protein
MVACRVRDERRVGYCEHQHKGIKILFLLNSNNNIVIILFFLFLSSQEISDHGREKNNNNLLFLFVCLWLFLRLKQPRRGRVAPRAGCEWGGKSGDHETWDRATAKKGRCNLPSRT